MVICGGGGGDREKHELLRDDHVLFACRSSLHKSSSFSELSHYHTRAYYMQAS